MIPFHAGNLVRVDIDYYPNDPNRAGERGVVTGIREELQWGPRGVVTGIREELQWGHGWREARAPCRGSRVITLEVELREPIPDESEASS